MEMCCTIMLILLLLLLGTLTTGSLAQVNLIKIGLNSLFHSFFSATPGLLANFCKSFESIRGRIDSSKQFKNNTAASVQKKAP